MEEISYKHTVIRLRALAPVMSIRTVFSLRIRKRNSANILINLSYLHSMSLSKCQIFACVMLSDAEKHT